MPDQTETKDFKIPVIMKFFKYGHLPGRLHDISKPFCDLARTVASRNPESDETLMALRKLLEAKDCAVRAAL